MRKEKREKCVFALCCENGRSGKTWNSKKAALIEFPFKSRLMRKDERERERETKKEEDERE